jgi:putative ABC transport system substrate-binding protein
MEAWMNARAWICRLLPVFCLATVTVAASAEEVRRMGILFGGSEAQRSSLERTLLETLRDKGFIEGRNLVITRRYAEGDRTRLAAYAKELEGLNPEVVLTMCTPSTRAMSAASADIPIVMGMVTDPVGQKLVASLARPGRNVTGTANLYEEVVSKTLEIFASVLPREALVAVLVNPANAAHGRLWPIAEEAAGVLRIKLRRYEVTSPAATLGVLQSILPDRPQAIYAFPDDPMLSGRATTISEFAILHRLPTLYHARDHVEGGGLLGYGLSFADGFKQAGRYVERILKGAKPAELPVEQPTRFELSVNLKTAKAIGLSIPPLVLLRADWVIE